MTTYTDQTLSSLLASLRLVSNIAMILPIYPVLLCLSLFQNRPTKILIVSDFVPSSQPEHCFLPFVHSIPHIIELSLTSAGVSNMQWLYGFPLIPFSPPSLF